MNRALEEAWDESSRGLASDSTHLVAHILRQEVIGQRSWSSEHVALLEQGLRFFPTSYFLWRTALFNATPSWGGSFEAMDSLASAAEKVVSENPRLRGLRGHIYSTAGSAARRRNEFAEALSMYDTALSYAEEYNFFRGRAETFAYARDFVRALEDINRAIALRPNNPQTLELRGKILTVLAMEAPMERRESVVGHAIRDYQYLSFLDPDDEEAAEILPTLKMLRRWCREQSDRCSASEGGMVLPFPLDEIAGVVSSVYNQFNKYNVLPHWTFLLVIVGANLNLWRRGGYWMPRYVHVLAFGSLMVILSINWLWIQAGGEMWATRYVVIGLFPAVVYFVFMTFGGMRAALKRRESPWAQAQARANDSGTPYAVPSVRPWMRFWARGLDVFLAQFVGGVCLGVLAVMGSPIPLWATPAVLALLFFLAWHVIEPLLLATWGTTPGKSLFRISVRTPDDRRPSLSAAAKRSFLVGLRGAGVGIPIIFLFTGIHAYRVLAKHKRATWDRDTNLEVFHGSFGAVRRVFIVILGLGIFGVVVLGGMG